MKLYLPHREVNLDSSLSFEERNQVIYKLLEETIEFHEQTMTVEGYFRYTWNKQPTKVSMDIIGYYLTKNNINEEELKTIAEDEDTSDEEKNNEEDRWVISNKKQKEMRKGSKRHTTFSGMGYDNQVKVGLIDIEE